MPKGAEGPFPIARGRAFVSLTLALSLARVVHRRDDHNHGEG